MNDLPLWAFFERQLLATEIVDHFNSAITLALPNHIIATAASNFRSLVNISVC